MDPGLTEGDEERFAALREKLEGVEPARPEGDPDPRPVELGPLDPMLATAYTGSLEALDAGAWYAEPKYDGTRIILQHLDGELRAYTRRAVERASILPEVISDAADAVPEGTILDGEYSYVTPDGGTKFIPIHAAGEKLDDHNLTPVYYVFDILVADHDWVTRNPLTDRKALLEDTVDETPHIAYTPVRTSELQAFYDELVAGDEEGIILKRRTSHYYPGTRSDHWRKVKAFTDADVLAVGYTQGEGARAETFGALVMTDGHHYRGRVGTGFTDADLHGILDYATPTTGEPVPESLVGRPYTPVEPFVITVKYQDITDNGELRAPVFLHINHDKPPSDVTPLDTS